MNSVSESGNDKNHVILIAYDGSRQAKRAINYVGKFFPGNNVVLVTAWECFQLQAVRTSGASGIVQCDWDSENMIEDPSLTDARKFAYEGAQLAKAAGLESESYIVQYSTSIWNAITKVADMLDADLIVTGTHGRTGFAELMRPSVSERVLKNGHRPVLIVPPEN
ncbi:MAG TPA: universal stress protein [Corynebacteriales bacterium]|nr:universal stress protein [Mycobacteriales bacterium]